MANGKFKEQINKNCSTDNWDQGNDTHAPNDQAMSGGVSTVKQKCNAATNESQEDDDMAETYSGIQNAGNQTGTTVNSGWKDSTLGGNSTPTDAGGHGNDGSQTMQGGGPEYTENHDGPFYGGVDDQYIGVRNVRTGGTGARSDMGPEGPTMGFTGDPTENGTVNSGAGNVLRDLKNQTTATREDTVPVNRTSDRAVQDADEAQVKAENAANNARAAAENAANTAEAKAENAANTVEEKGGGIMDTMKNRAEEFFNTDFDRDGTIGEGMGTTVNTVNDLQDPDIEHGTRSAASNKADKRVPTAVGF